MRRGFLYHSRGHFIFQVEGQITMGMKQLSLEKSDGTIKEISAPVVVKDYNAAMGVWTNWIS